MAIRVLRGDAALAAMDEPAFLAGWRALFQACPWATAAQAPGFVRLRCACYRSVAAPLLLAEWSDGRLVGLLPLAVPAGQADALGAACEDAEYHAWLAEPGRGDGFMPAALAALWREGTVAAVRLRYLPVGAPTAWLGEAPWSRRATVRPLETRVLRLDDPARVQAFLAAKKSTRRKRAALERLGRVTFRRLEGPAGFEPVLEAFVAMHSARRLAQTGSAVFERDPLKRGYLLARQHAPGMQHATVLELDGRPVAAHLGPTGRPGGHFTFSGVAFDAAYQRYSPGALLLWELIGLACREGYRRFDLTPGGDGYKERWGDAAEEVHEVVLYPSWARRRLGEARERLRRTARRAGRLLSAPRPTPQGAEARASAARPR